MFNLNAISWAQFQLRGGWRSVGITAALYGAAVLILIGFTMKVDPRNFGRLAGWTTFLMTVQTGVLLLFAGSRINQAIRNDLVGRMIESHRLMPLSAPSAIAGYMWGASSHALCLAMVNLVIGVGLCSVGGLAVDRWLMGNAVLFMFALFIWSIIALTAFSANPAARMSAGKFRGGGIGWIVGLSFFSFSSQGMITVILPAVAVLASPIMGGSIYSMSPGAGGTSLTAAYAMSLAGQLVIGATCFLAAGRKYRSAETSAFTPGMGLIVLGTWVILSVFAMAWWDRVQPGIFGRAGGFRAGGLAKVQVISSLLSSMLLALVPLSAGVRIYAGWTRQRALDDPALPQRRPTHPALVVVLVAAICTLVVVGGEPSDELRLAWWRTTAPARSADVVVTVALTSVIVLAFAGSIASLMRLLNRGRGRGAGWLLLGFLALTWAVPLLLDAARHAAAEDWNDRAMQTVSTFSPVGALVTVWGTGRSDPTPGVVGQVVLAVLLFAILRLATRGPGWREAEPSTVAEPARRTGTPGDDSRVDHVS